PGEQLEVLVDGELVKVFDWDKVMGRTGFEDRSQDDENAAKATLPTLDVTVPMKAGPHEIGITFIARNFAPGLDMNNDFERSTIETGGLPGFTCFPHVGSVRVDGPYNPAGISGTTPSREILFSCYPANESEQAPCAQEIIAKFARLAFRGKDDPDD